MVRHRRRIPTNADLGLPSLRCACGKRRNVTFCPECRRTDLDPPPGWEEKPPQPRKVVRNCDRCRAPFTTRRGARFCPRCERTILEEMEEAGYLKDAG